MEWLNSVPVGTLPSQWITVALNAGCEMLLYITGTGGLGLADTAFDTTSSFFLR